MPPRNKRRVTSHDVARRAGVSRTTVSLVLNRSNAVSLSPETRERVLAAAAELRYTPDSAARMLVRGATETIGLLVSHPELLLFDAFVPQVLLGISRVADGHGYRVLLEPVPKGQDPNRYLKLVEGRRIDGLIVLNPQTEDPQLAALVERRYPVVLLGSVRHPREHTVNCATAAGVQGVIHHLAELGRRRIAHITFSPGGYIGTDLRLAAYRQTLQELGLRSDTRLEAEGAFSAESGYHAMQGLLGRKPLPDALFAGNDTIALGALAAIHERGLRIPDDVAVAGFDDLPIAAYAWPPLTTVRNPAIRQGELAAEMLVDLLHEREVAEPRIEVPTELVVRASTTGLRPAASRPRKAAAGGGA
jgi:DNA-binding LacI/PurR family transcriptional regulator